MGKVKKAVCLLLTAVLFASSAGPASAQDDSASAQPEEKADAKLTTVQERLETIRAQKGKAEEYLSELETQLAELTEELDGLQGEYREKRARLDLVSQQLADAEKTASLQETSMALRIQFMYENSVGSGLLSSLFKDGDFREILNRASYIQELSEFDRKMLEEYAAVCDEIETKRDEVEAEQQEIEKLSAASLEKREELQTIYEETLSDISEMEASIEDGQEEEARLLASVKTKEEELAVWFVDPADEVAAADSYAAQYVQPADGSYAAPAGDPGTEPGEGQPGPEAADPAADDPGTEPGEGQSGQEAADPAADDPGTEPGEGQPGSEAANPQSDEPDGEAGTGQPGPDGTEQGSGDAPAEESTVPESTWDGPRLTRQAGVNEGPTGKETYYNLDMSGVLGIMRDMGNTDQYWVRDDGVKMLGDYVMVAADLEEHPRGSIVESSLGQAIVVDTGALEKDQLDIAATW